MADLISYGLCPCCASTAIYPALSAKDHTVSGEIFEIWHCDDCTIRFTQRVPKASAIGPYYQSVSYVSHSDTQKGLINRLYHMVRNRTLNSKRKLVQEVTRKETGNLLDVGAGTGAFANTMQQAGWTVTALEPDDIARENASNKYGLQLQSPENLFRLDASQFDAITMWHVLEHVHDLHAYLTQFEVILKPGGRLIIAVPNYTSYDAKAYKEFWAAYDVPRHLYHFSPKSMELLGNRKGFTLIDTKPMWFDSFYVSMLSEQYKNGSGNLIGAMWNGMISNVKALGEKKKCSSVIYIFSKK
ncbi:MAG: class SAM-dependent methyltransferase [Sediminibacterium sp.]|nr:class SAM-dependent methyltransferase [Sediminibacterium sp.]